MQTKICCHCKEEKPISQFFRDSRLKDGFMGRCKICSKLSKERIRFSIKISLEQKECTNCHDIKPSSEFSRYILSKDGLQPHCKTCQQKYRATVSGQETAKRAQEKFRDSAKYKAIQKRFLETEKGKRYHREKMQRYRRNNPEKGIARASVKRAIKSGKLPHPSQLTCSYISQECTGRMEYHHHKGYSNEYKLDVIPVCKYHHNLIEQHIPSIN